MLIRVYDKIGNQISQELFEGSLLDYIKREAGDNYNPSVAPYSATLNGCEFPHVDHDKPLHTDDIVDVTLEPRAQIVAVIVAIIAAAYAYYITRNIDTGYSAPEDQQSIYTSNVRANQVRPNQIIREVAGKIPIYPDYINPVRRRYENNNEFVHLMLSVGVGYFELNSSNIYIAETPISYYAGDIILNIYEPGDDVTGNIAHENWYTSPDVDSLVLKTTPDEASGTWTAIFDSSMTIQSFDDGSAAVFPFAVDEIFTVTDANTAANEQIYRVDSLSTTTSTDDTATVTVMTETSPGIYEENASGTITTDTIASVTWEAVTGGVNWEGPFVLCPSGETTTEFEFDVSFPAGLFRITGGGSQVSYTVAIEAQYRDSALGGSWSTVSGTSWTANTNDEIGYTISQTLGSAYNPEVRFRRVTGDSTSTQVNDEVMIKRVKTQLETATSYSDITAIAIKIRSTRALSRSAENQISVRGAQRKLPTLAETQANIDSGTAIDLTSATHAVAATSYDIERAALTNSCFTNEISLSAGEYAGAVMAEDGNSVLIARYTTGPSALYIDNYPLSTAYDLETADFTSLTTSSGLGLRYFGQMFDSGNRIFGIETNGSLKAYSLSTPYDAGSTLVLQETVDFALGGEEFAFIAGTKLYVLYLNTGVYYIRQYTMSTAGRINTASYDSVEFDCTSYGTVRQIFVNETNLILFTPTTVHQLDITSYDLSTASANATLTVSPDNYFYNFNNDGTKMYSANPPGVGETGADFFTYSTTFEGDDRATSSIGRFFAYMLNDRLGSDLSGYVDWSAISTLDTDTASEGLTLDGEFSKQTTIWEASKLLLSPGYAEPVVKNGQLTVTRNIAGSNYQHLYTPDIMINGVTTIAEHDRSEEPDGIIVEYLNENTGVYETVNAYLSGDTGARTKKLEAFGITDRTNAYRFGMRERERERNRPQEYRFTTEMDGLNSFYGDAIGIVDDLDAPQFGKVTNVAGSTVTTDQTLTFAGSDIAFFRDDEGVSYGPFQVSAGGTSYQLTLDSPTSLGFTPGDYDVYFSLGTADQVVKRAIIRSIVPNEDKTCDIIAEEYVAAIYSHDSEDP